MDANKKAKSLINMSNMDGSGMNYYLDRLSQIEIKKGGHLPHWFQSDKLQFVTFRLGDSLPQLKLEELSRKKLLFLENHPKPWDETVRREYEKTVGKLTDQYLDSGYGECVLRIPEVREILRNALFYKANVDYIIAAYVLMPNHVHLLLALCGERKLEDILHSVKSFSSTKINRLLGRSGRLWQKENFDRIVRSYEHYKHCMKYIEANPRFLKEGDYELYFNNSFFPE